MTVPTRVLHVIPAVAPRYGGPSTAVFAMCRAVQAHGVTTLIATTDADGAQRLPGISGEASDINGVPVVMFPRQLSESFKWSSGLARWLTLHAAEFDVVHVHAVFSHASIAAGRAARHAGVPYVVRPLGTLDPWSLGHHAWRKRLLLSLGVRHLLTQAALMHYTSVEEQRLAEERLPFLPEGRVVPLGVDDRLFSREASDRGARTRRIVTMTRLHPKKGIDLLIDAFHGVDAALGRTWSLHIAGDGDRAYARALRERAVDGPGRERIHFHGWLEGSARVDLLRSADVFALPSHQENFGIAVAEALACGVPAVIAPGVNLAGEIASAGAGWIVERDRNALADLLRHVAADDADRERRGAAARILAQRYRWSATARPLTDLYTRALSSCAA